jgi:hypothetical protein
MSVVHSAYSLVLPPTAELILVVKETQLLNNVIHYQVGVYLRLVSHVFLVCFTQLADLVDVKSLVWVYLQHANHQGAKLLAVSLWWRGEVTL